MKVKLITTLLMTILLFCLCLSAFAQNVSAKVLEVTLVPETEETRNEVEEEAEITGIETTPVDEDTEENNSEDTVPFTVEETLEAITVNEVPTVEMIPTELPTQTPTQVPAGFLNRIADNSIILVGICAAAIAAGAAVLIFGRNKKHDRKDTGRGVSATSIIYKEGIYLFGSCLGQGKRDYQEDSLWYTEDQDPEKPVIAVIADGMGGMENGAESSAKAVEKFRTRAMRIDNDQDIPVKLWRICNSVNDDVYAQNSMKNMNGGSTLVAVLIKHNQLYWISAGDSRIYLYRDGMLADINEEHELENSLYSQMLDGEIDLIDIRETPNRELRKLTSNLGRVNVPLIDQNLIPYKLHKGDKILLCSDGVSGTLSEKEIASCLESRDPESNCDRIAAMVEDKEKRGQDNYSAIVVYCATEDGK